MKVGKNEIINYIHNLDNYKRYRVNNKITPHREWWEVVGIY